MSIYYYVSIIIYLNNFKFINLPAIRHASVVVLQAHALSSIHLQ